MLLVVRLMTIGASAALLIRPSKLTRAIAGGMGALAGLFSVVDGFGNMLSFSSAREVFVRPALMIISILSLVLLAASTLVLLGLRKQTTTT